jgi:hypothetical protein
MHNNAKIGGILSIVAGGLGCFSALVVFLFVVFMGFLFSSEEVSRNAAATDFPFYIFAIMYAVLGVIGLLLSILAIIGGVYGLKKKNWGLALAGSIAGVLAFYPCGIVAVIFTSMGKGEFGTAPAVRA